MAYFAPSMFLFTVHIAMEAFRADVLTNAFSGFVADPSSNKVLNGFVYTMDFIYVMLICSVVFFSLHLTNSNKKFKPYIYAISTLFGIFAIIVFLVLIVDVIRGLVNNDSCIYAIIQFYRKIKN